MEQLIGQSLGRYKLTKLLGEGGMGAVYKATDVTLQRDVAVKIMHPHTAKQPNFRDRFLQEARTAARLDHPSIVKVYDFGQERGLLYIVMEFIAGANLRNMLEDLKAQRKWLPLQESIQIIQHVCMAMDYAHHQGVLHRDLKPSNVMIEPEATEGLPYRPVLTDLGLARLMQADHITQAGTSMGTPTYMSPEQALGEETDARSDVYSLGVMLYELVVARPPFEVRSLTEAIRSHTKETPPPPRQFRPDLPQALEQVILKALSKEPRHRYENAAAMAQALNGVLGSATQIDASPQAAQQHVSLLTQYEQSVSEQRGPSILREFETPVENGDTLQVRLPDGSVRNIPFIGRSMIIGRSEDADIVVNTGKVSRQHARIEFTGDDFRVTDLDSTNGTYLANARLLPGVPEAWKTDQPLRVGDVWLRLVRPGNAHTGTSPMGPGPSAATPFSAVVDPRMIRSSIGGDGRVGVVMQEQQLSVMPGESVTTDVVLLNQGTVVDHFSITVEGIPATWVKLPDTVQLLPGQQQNVALTLHPPRESKSRAGRYAVTLRVLSRDNPMQRVEVKFALTVQAFNAFSSQIYPQKVSQNKPVSITLVNQGNLPQVYTVSSTDRADALNFTPPQAQVNVAEGQTEKVTLRGQPRQRKLIGRPESVPFSVKVSGPQGQPQTHAGEIIAKPLFPIWLLSLAMLLGMIACVVGILLLTRAPVIESVALVPTNPGAGEPVTIRWQVTNANRIELRPFGVEVSPEAGEYTFEEGFPDTTSVTLVAYSLMREAREVLPVNVTITILDPVIEEWEVFPTEITEGQEITIRWNVLNAETVTLRPFGTVDNSGTMQDTPQTTKTYTLVATNQGKTVEKAQEVIVSPPKPDAPKVTEFSVSPTTAVQGMDATIKLTWATEQADTVTIEPGLGPVGLSGSRDIPLPASDTIYTLVAKGPGGELTSEVSVKVEPQQCVATSHDLNVREGPGTVYDPEIAKINSGDKVKPLAYSPNGYPDGTWVQVEVVSTGVIGWVHKDFLNCNINATMLPPAAAIPPTPIPPVEISNIVVTVMPPTYTGACPKNFDFKADITVTQAGTVTYKWIRSDNAGSTEESLTFDAPGTKTVTSSWQLSAEGTRWKAIEILTPAPMTSNKAEFTLTCAQAIAYVYASNQTSADAYEAMLEDADFAVDLIKMADVMSADFTKYDLVLIAADTGTGADWGDGSNNQRNRINGANKPVIGLGRGGSTFFEDIGLDIGWMSAWTGSRKEVFVVAPAHPVWTDPYALTIPADRILDIYSANVGFVGVYLPGPIAGVTAIGRQHDNMEHFIVIQQNDRYLLWGFDGGPEDMTGTGKRVFLNTVKYMLD